MNTKNLIIAIVLSGIILLSLLFVAKYLFFQEDLTNVKTINSVGNAELTAQPDQVEVYARIEVLKQTAEEASNEGKIKSNAVLDAIKKFDAEVETTSYNVYKKEDWTEKGSVFKGYVASYTLKVKTNKFDDIGKIIDSAVENGATGIDSVQFILSKDEEEKVRSEALKQASENAKMKAEAVANGLSVGLGDIISVSESNFYAPPIFYAKATEAVVAGERVADLQIEPTSLQVTASVSITYEIEN